MVTTDDPHARPVRTAGLLAGPAAFALILAVPAIGGMPPEAQAVSALVAWMAIWWLTEAVPIPATALLPIVLLPLLSGHGIGEVTRRYGDSVIFLFLGGFILSIAVQKWGLHRRMALLVLHRTGSTPRRMVLGFMLATGLLSMWFSNSATAIMMVPVAAAALVTVPLGGSDERPGRPTLAAALMLAIAYGATIGGLATIIGSPPNAIFVGHARDLLGIDIGFVQWMLFGVPLALVVGVVAYVYLTRVAFRGVMAADDAALSLPEAPGEPMRAPERRVLAVFGLVALGWLLRGVLDGVPAIAAVSDAGVAIAGGVALFAIPSRGGSGERLLDWNDLAGLPWGILVLFGGGLALAGAVQSSGLAAWIASGAGVLEGLTPLVVLGVVALVIIFLTEITSNTATASVFMPIVAAFALVASLHPFLPMMIASTAASCAFMLPVATPPNAVVFASGRLTIGSMARAGVALNLMLVPVLALAAVYLLPLVWPIVAGR